MKRWLITALIATLALVGGILTELVSYEVQQQFQQTLGASYRSVIFGAFALFAILTVVFALRDLSERGSNLIETSGREQSVPAKTQAKDGRGRADVATIEQSHAKQTSRKSVLEQSIDKSHKLVIEYENLLNGAATPMERHRWVQERDFQLQLIEEYGREYITLCKVIGQPLSDQIRELLARFPSLSQSV